MMRFQKTIFPLLWALLLLQPLSSAEAKEQKRVLILYSEDKAHPAHELTDKGIREAFRSNELFDVRLYDEYLDLSRFGSPSHARAVADYLGHKYAGLVIDAIIAVYPNAADFLLEERFTLFPEVPIVASEITRGQAGSLEQSPARPRVTGTILGDNVTGLIDAALGLRPKTRHIALVAGTTPNDAYGEQIMVRGLAPYAGRIAVIDLSKRTMEDTLSQVSSLPPDTLIFYSSLFRDGAGKSFVPREALSLVAQAANAPIFGLYETYLGFGIVGGRLVSFEEHGKEAAQAALRILSGTSPASIPFGGDQTYVDAYDWRELKRWDLNDAALQPGAEIRFRTSSVWDEHRGAILGVAALILFESFLILGLLLNVRRRRNAERALGQHEKELMTLTGRLINTQEEELRRLSRDLHDDLTQKLAVLAIDAGMLEKILRPLRPEASQELADLKLRLIEVSDEVHNLSRQIHPSILVDLGLVQAFQSECDLFSRRTGIAVSFEPGDIPSSVPKDAALCLYRVLQEGLQNISKHSEAGEARIVLSSLSQSIRLLIQDSGVGFSVQQAAGKGGIGLTSMRERVRLVNGEVSVLSEPGKGTELHVFIPLEENNVQATSAHR